MHSMRRTLWVKKADGSTEPFRGEKLARSLERAGARPEEIERIIDHLVAFHQGEFSTDEIYDHAFTYLKRIHPLAAARYSLRRALFSLGPTGFPFEAFVAALFRERGYMAQRGVQLQGRCLTHEMDIVAERGSERIIAELKFHNHPSQRVDTKVALYVRARFDDILAHAASLAEVPTTHCYLITNTKFTSSAIRYARCVGIHLIGWSYPPRGNLADLITRTRLIPVTALTTLSFAYKERLLEEGVLLVRSLLEDPAILRRIGMKRVHRARVLAEARGLLS